MSCLNEIIKNELKISKVYILSVICCHCFLGFQTAKIIELDYSIMVQFTPLLFIHHYQRRWSEVVSRIYLLVDAHRLFIVKGHILILQENFQNTM